MNRFMSWLALLMAWAAWQPQSPSSPRGYEAPAMVYDAGRQAIVHFGGADTVVTGETWLMTARGWERLTIEGPSARIAASMAYDSRRGRVVLFGGGLFGRMLGDTWEFDGQRWSKLTDSGPGPRGGAAIAYDSARGRTVLYGGSVGRNQDPVDGHTWEWDGARWHRIETEGPPGPGLSSMAYDARRGRIVKFGGRDAGTDTWEWDGARWTKVEATGPKPPPREHHSMTYDTSRKRVILFGGGGQPTGIKGYTEDNPWLTDLWDWDGTRWTLLDSEGPPVTVRLVSPGLAHDAARGRLVVYAGTLGGTWEWRGAGWNKRD